MKWSQFKINIILTLWDGLDEIFYDIFAFLNQKWKAGWKYPRMKYNSDNVDIEENGNLPVIDKLVINT